MTIKYADVESVLAALMETERQLTQVRAENDRLQQVLMNNQQRREQVEARHGDLLREVERLRAALDELWDAADKFLENDSQENWSLLYESHDKAADALDRTKAR